MSKKKYEPFKRKPSEPKSATAFAIPNPPRPLLGIYSFWVALATLVLSAISLGWGLPMIIPSNPHNGLILFMSGLIISGILFTHAYEVWRQKNLGRRWIVILLISFFALVLLAFNIQFTEAKNTSGQPDLMQDDTTTRVRPDNTALISVKNIGSATAWQFSASIVFAPKSKLDYATVATVIPSSNRIPPNQYAHHDLDILGGFKQAKGIPVAPDEMWYVYYQLRYSDSPVGGTFRYEDGWWEINFARIPKRFLDLPLTERPIFEPFVRKALEKKP